MKAVRVGQAWRLVLLLGLVFLAELNAGQECGALVDNTAAPQTAQKTIAPLAQKLVINDNCYVQSFTVSFAAASPVALSAAAIYEDNDNVPGSPIPGATFNIDEPLPASASTLYTFNSTQPAGIQLLVGGSYWLVINKPGIVYQPLSTTSSQTATNATVIELLQLAQYEAGFQSWTSIDTQSFRMALQGCRGLLPSPLPSPSPSPSPSLTPYASLSPTPSSPPTRASPSPVPSLSPVVRDVKASFDPQQPVVDVIADALAPGAVGVRSSLRDLQIGGKQAVVDDFEVEVENGTETTPALYTYSALLADNATRFGQSFEFYNDSAEASFDSISFGISPGTLKWSLNLTTNAPQEPFVIRYGLSAFIESSTSTALIAATEEAIVKQADTPQPGMTTYFLPFVTLPSSSSSSSRSRLIAKVEVFDAALVDGLSVSLHHDVVVAETNGSAQFVLVLEFAAFSSSLFYDPSLSLGVLLGTRDSDDGGDSDDKLALIVATSVVLPVAALVGVLVTVVGAIVLWKRKKLARHRVKERLSRLKDDPL